VAEVAESTPPEAVPEEGSASPVVPEEGAPESASSESDGAEAGPPEEGRSEPPAAEPEASEAGAEPGAEPEEAPAPAPAAPPEDDNKSWYIVHTYSGYEQKVKLSIEKQIEKFRSSKQARFRQIASYFGDILIPTENVVELVKGQRKTSKRKFFPGYIMIQMENNDESRHFIRETPKVSGFVGGGREPAPISEDELQRILRQQSEGAERPKPKVQFERGENIRVIHGPFSNFTGVVDDVKPEKGKVKVLVTIFGRATPVELSFVEVEKA
jgi:transcriptional antiterminator NusG